MDVHDLVNNEPAPMSHHAFFLSLDHLPSPQQTAQAKASVEQYETEAVLIQEKIQHETDAVSALLEAHHARIRALRQQEEELQDKIVHSRAYLAPIRKLPNEVLGEVFLIIFRDGNTKCAWTLASVNTVWRRVALSLHVLWSSISLVSTATLCQPDTIRLWLERSGSHCPIDVDITLKSNAATTSPEKALPTTRRRLFPGASSHYNHALPSLWNAVGGLGSQSHGPTSLSPPHGAHSSQTQSTETEQPWGYIVFYYLVAQLHRWRRFRFVFGTPFTSLKALDSIQGSAPLLEEFIVGCTESSFFPPASEQWQWLPSFVAPAGSPSATRLPTPNLKALELRNVPFRWSSPLLTHLRKLKLVSNNLSVQPLTLNRILSIIQASPQIEILELNVVAQAQILPLAPVTLENLREIKLGCSQGQNSLLQQLIGQLITPSLESLTIEADSRSESSTMAEVLTSLFIRSGQPAIKSFSYGLPSSSSSGPSPYTTYGSLGFPTSLLRHMYHLESLTVASCPMESILVALASTANNQDDDDNESEFGGPPGLFPPSPPVPQTPFMTGFDTTGGGGAFGNAPTLPPSIPTIQLGNIANALHSTTGAHNANLPSIIATAASNLAAAVAAAANAPTSANALPQFNDDYLCPYLRTLTFKHCHPHSDGVSKIIRMVQTRNPDGEPAGGQAIPRPISTLEFLDCGHIGGDVIEWLEERIMKVVYTEASNSASHCSFRNSNPYGFGF